jgi:hypothetical protein
MNKIDNLLTLIAKQHLGIDTLETRNSDSLDSHDVGVVNLKDALYAAFVIGCEAGINNRAESESEIYKYNQRNQVMDKELAA